MNDSTKQLKKSSLWSTDSSKYKNSITTELLEVQLTEERIMEAANQKPDSDATKPFTRPFDESCMATLVG